MIVGQGVENGLAVLPGLDQPVCLEDAQLVGDGGLGQAQQLGDVAHAQLRFEQGVQDLDAGGVAEDLEQLGQIVQLLVVGHFPEHLLHGLLVNAQEAAALHVLFGISHRVSLLSKTNM